MADHDVSTTANWSTREIPSGPTAWLRRVTGLWRVAIAAQITYRASTVQLIVSSALYQSLQLIFLGILLGHFGSIGSWSAPDILLLFGVRSCAHAIYTIPFWQVQSVDYMLREGRFDHILHRPASPFVQVVAGGFNIATLGDAVIGIAVIVPALALHPSLGPASVGYLLLAIIGGGLVEASIQILLAAAAFPLRKTDEMRSLIETLFSDLGGIPLDILGRFGALVFTIIPIAFVAYLPVTAALGKPTYMPHAVATASPAAGPILFAVAVASFNRAIRYYDSPNPA